jgi:hypothetical protein
LISNHTDTPLIGAHGGDHGRTRADPTLIGELRRNQGRTRDEALIVEVQRPPSPEPLIAATSPDHGRIGAV